MYYLRQMPNARKKLEVEMSKRASGLRPCPVCGKKAFLVHLQSGWAAGCPAFDVGDGVHGVTEEMPRDTHFIISGCPYEDVAIYKWNRKADRWKVEHGEF